MRKLTIYFLMLGMFINSGYALNTTDLDFSFPVLLVMLFIQFCLLLTQKIYWDVRLASGCAIFIVLILISYLVHGGTDSVFFIVKLVLIILSAYLFHLILSPEEFVHVFIRTMRMITLISLFLYGVRLLLGSVLPIVINRNGVSYETGIVTFFIEDSSRLLGIFWEPGILATYIIISLVLMILYHIKRTFTVSIFLLALLLTQSTAGFGLLLLVGVLYLVHDIAHFNLKLLFLLVISLILFIFMENIIEILLYYFPEIFIKLVQKHTSTSTRINSFWLNYQVYMTAPISGLGFSQANYLYTLLMQKTYSQYLVVSQTSTTGYFLASMGISGGIYTWEWFINCMRTPYPIIEKLIIFILFLLIVNKEPHTLFLATYSIMFLFGRKGIQI
ncbi:hypothetical protein [Streptococcus sp. S784/96/1]|uniref:hypothetical protein n=1 Tax=Streptococcus sp. S784/96/1 TaxID=2653499 RepID=UPI001386D5EF|nr:hypothetical protein [Streptococcus sp. S784/96/1]